MKERSTADPRIWDPTVVGPTDRCLRCFSPSGAEFIVCKRCGHASGTLAVPLDVTGVSCHQHRDKPAAAYCGWCGRPVCAACIERQGINLIGIGARTYCKECVALQQATEATFFEGLRRSGACAKHADRPATARCTACQLPVCDLCSYFILGGVFRKRVHSGPLCLTCFRLRIGRERGHWIAGVDLPSEVRRATPDARFK